MDWLGLVMPILTLVFGFWVKGQYDRKMNSIDVSKTEHLTYIDLGNKFETEFIALRSELLERGKIISQIKDLNQDLVLKLDESNEQNKTLVAKLEEMSKAMVAIKSDNERLILQVKELSEKVDLLEQHNDILRKGISR